MKKDLFIAKKRRPNILGFPNLEDKVLEDKVPEEVPEVIVQKEEGFDSCLEEILVKGLGFDICSNKKLQ